MQAFSTDGLQTTRAAAAKPYHEFLRSGSLSAGLYVLPAGGIDRQSPHTEDEVYHVIAGRAMFFTGGEDFAVGPGSILFVPALVEHRFHTIMEELTILVVFAPPEGANATIAPGI